MTPRVSIVITCYQLGQYLEEAVRSVQQYPDANFYELIIVDDGSSDPRTVEVLARLEFEGLRVIRQPNSGLAVARNNGIRAAVGRYVIPLDADNRLRSAMIERTVAVLDAEQDVEVVYGDANYFGEREGHWVVGPYDFALLVERNRIDACAGFRKSLWERVGGYDENMPVMGYEDWDFWLRCSVAGAHFHYEPDIFFDYRVRQGSMLTNTMNNRSLLVEYIFSKPQLRFLAPLRNAYLDALQRERERPVLTGSQLVRMLVDRVGQRIRTLGGGS